MVPAKGFDCQKCLDTVQYPDGTCELRPYEGCWTNESGRRIPYGSFCVFGVEAETEPLKRGKKK